MAPHARSRTPRWTAPEVRDPSVGSDATSQTSPATKLPSPVHTEPLRGIHTMSVDFHGDQIHVRPK